MNGAESSEKRIEGPEKYRELGLAYMVMTDTEFLDSLSCDRTGGREIEKKVDRISLQASNARDAITGGLLVIGGLLWRVSGGSDDRGGNDQLLHRTGAFIESLAETLEAVNVIQDRVLYFRESHRKNGGSQ